MFLHRQDVIDELDALFEHGEDGTCRFRPRGEDHALAISQERYALVMGAVVARHRRAMLTTWIMGFLLGAGSIWMVIAHDDYAAALGLLALNFVCAIAHHWTQGRAALDPLLREWNESRRILSKT